MIENVRIETDLLIARPIPDGWTYTLASRLGHILRILEDRFGPRDRSYTILGVEIGGETPQIWYPGNCKNVVVQITRDCLTDMARACYQLAHEAVHLLSPTGGRNANNFEEGLAVYFQEAYMRNEFGQTSWRPVIPSYERARALLAPHLDAVPDAIRRMRETEPTISRITADAMRREFSNLTVEDANFLAERFVRG
jgi:hypothetical protein